MRVKLMEPHGNGGINYYAQALADSVAQAGADVELLTTIHSESLSGPSGGARIIARLEGFQEASKLPRLVRRARSAVLHARNYSIVRGEMSAPGFDVVHFVSEPKKWADYCMKAVSQHHPTVHTVHNILPHDSDPESAIPYWRRIYESVDVLICHNQATVDGLDEMFGHEVSSRTRIIPLPVDNMSWPDPAELEMAGARNALGLPIAAFLVLAFGAIRPYKALEVAIEAMCGVRESTTGARLVVAGACDDWAPYAAIIENLDIADLVIERVGWVEKSDIPLYFAAADVAVLPYRSIDGSGVAAVGAFVGTPMILSDIPGFRAVWSDDEVLYVRGGVDNWSAAIDEVRASPEEAAARARRVRQRTATEMTWAASASAHLDAYQLAIRRFAAR